MNNTKKIVVLSGGTSGPTFTITAPSAAANVVSMQIVASEEVADFVVGDITISAGSLASFATADNITFTVDWTLASGSNTMDIAAGVCTSAATGKDNKAATQFALEYLILQPDASAGLDTYINKNAATFNYGITTSVYAGGGATAADVVRTLLRFSEIPVPASTPTVLSADLAMTCTDSGSGVARNMDFHRALTQWYEGTKNGASPAGVDGSTWNLSNDNGSVAWAGGAGGAAVVDWISTATAEVSVVGTGVYTFDVVTDVQDWMSGNATNYGWFLKGALESVNTYKGFASSDNATAGNRPKLSIVYF